MTPLQLDFLLHEYATLSINGAFQHVAIYAPGVPETERTEVRLHLRDLLDKLSLEYKAQVPDARHISNIQRLANSLTRRHAGVLHEGRFRIGPAQKALNLYLKYLWCNGLVPCPPHCPIDSTVLAAAGVETHIPWSRLSTTTEYAELIEKLRQAIGVMPLSEWELEAWGRDDA